MTKPDIEHVAVHDGPRQWLYARKMATLLLVSSASLITTIAAGIHRRIVVYIVSITLIVGGSAGAALSSSIGLLIGMQCVQAAGSSAVLAISAATLADIYDSHDAPLLGPSLGPILGGGLTQGFDWRACFWFLVIFGGLNLLSFTFLFKDTFHRECSLAYHRVLRCNLEKSRPCEEKSPAANNRGVEGQPSAYQNIRLSLKDVDPISPILQVLRYFNNPVILTASGFIYGFSYSILYMSARVLAYVYHYDALHTGLVLLAFGTGSVAGSTLGGKWSHVTVHLAHHRVHCRNGGQKFPESTFFGMVFLPPLVIAYAGWTVQERVHIMAPCLFLFLCGLFSVWSYSSTLAYIVDSNVGQSSSAVATNSLFRGLFVFTVAEVAVLLQDNIGDGWTYTVWGGLMALTNVLILLAWWKGRYWHERGPSTLGS
ncbi:MFS general substrate transporter [Pilatotrama ljubarskyi]|nr:MFS general substrate transporter [Pilatotrama ljubarskyi]